MKGVAEHSFVWVEKYFFTFFVPHYMGNKVFINIPLIPLKFDWLSENPHTLLYSLVYTMSSLILTAAGSPSSHSRYSYPYSNKKPPEGRFFTPATIVRRSTPETRAKQALLTRRLLFAQCHRPPAECNTRQLPQPPEYIPFLRTPHPRALQLLCLSCFPDLYYS